MFLFVPQNEDTARLKMRTDEIIYTQNEDRFITYNYLQDEDSYRLRAYVL